MSLKKISHYEPNNNIEKNANNIELEISHSNNNFRATSSQLLSKKMAANEITQLTNDENATADNTDMQRKHIYGNRVLSFDLNRLNDLFNAYATRKTLTAGLFDLALMVANFTQIKQIVTANPVVWNPLNIILLVSICLSLLLQFIVAAALIYVAKQSEFLDDDKRAQLIRSNNWITLFVLIIVVINIFINVFINVK